MFGDVIVPLDGSEEAARALGPALAIAQYLDSTLRIIAYHDSGSDGVELTRQVHDNLKAVGEAHYVWSVEAIRTTVAEALGTVLEAHPSALVVMSTHGRGRAAAFIGSVANDLLHIATGPVLLVGPKADTDNFRLDGPLIVAVDDNDHAMSVLPVAESFGIVFGYTPELVEVVTPDEVDAMARAREGSMASDMPPESAGVQRAAAAVRKIVGREVNFEVLHDKHPPRALVEYATTRNAPLIAMATHAASGMSRLTHGSVTADTVSEAPCPVLAIRPPEITD